MHCLGKAKRNSGHVPRVKELLLSTLSPEQLVLTLLEAEPPNVLVSRPSMPFTEASMMMSLTKLADKELVHMIGWAKKIPGRTLLLDFVLFICDEAPLSYFGDSELHLDYIIVCLIFCFVTFYISDFLNPILILCISVWRYMTITAGAQGSQRCQIPRNWSYRK